MCVCVFERDSTVYRSKYSMHNRETPKTTKPDDHAFFTKSKVLSILSICRLGPRREW